MIFDWNRCCRLAQTAEQNGSASLALGEGLWAGLLSSGGCTLERNGEVLCGTSGDLLLGVGPLTLEPEPGGAFHLLAVRLEGLAAEEFARSLSKPMFADGAACPAAAELLARLDSGLTGAAAGAAAYALLCELSTADEAPQRLPPLAAAAVTAIRDNYMRLYGVEELSEQLGVSKCHLVRVFRAALGMPPGRYLVKTRIEAAKTLLREEDDYNLELIASLCGFSGANYFCRVFKKETGLTPAQWRAAAAPAPGARPLPLSAQEAFV